jgi:glycine dehydrogenase subunit 2
MRNQTTTQLLFELSRPGRCGSVLAGAGRARTSVRDLLPADSLAEAPPPCRRWRAGCGAPLQQSFHAEHVGRYALLPAGFVYDEVQPEAERAIEFAAGMVHLHPYQPEETLQGLLQILFELQQMLGEIAGLPAVTLQPAAGAHGELTALMVAAAYFPRGGTARDESAGSRQRSWNQSRQRPHGRVPDGHRPKHRAGFVDMDDLRAKLDDSVAVFMITNPNTLGLFDRRCPANRRSGTMRRAD